MHSRGHFSLSVAGCVVNQELPILSRDKVPYIQQNRPFLCEKSGYCGAARQIRTADLILTNVVKHYISGKIPCFCGYFVLIFSLCFCAQKFMRPHLCLKPYAPQGMKATEYPTGIMLISHSKPTAGIFHGAYQPLAPPYTRLKPCSKCLARGGPPSPLHPYNPL